MNKTCVFCSEDSGADTFRIRIGNMWLIRLDQMPVSRGHIMIIPTKHYSDLSQMSEPTRIELFKQGFVLGEKMKDVFGAKAYTLKLNNGLFQLDPDPGHVGHIHLHVVPRYKMDEGKINADEEYFAEFRKLLPSLTNKI